jgi:hypothetical protein
MLELIPAVLGGVLALHLGGVSVTIPRADVLSLRPAVRSQDQGPPEQLAPSGSYGSMRGTSQCWQPGDAYTGPVVAAIRQYVSASGAKADEFRTRAGLLSAAPDSVFVVTDEGLCHRASVALELLKPSPDTINLNQVLVIKAGPLRFVLDDGILSGGNEVRSVADTSFTIVGTIVN